MVYISTTSIINNKELFSVLNRYVDLGIKNIELGSVHNLIKEPLLFKFQKENNINFIIHGFFPPSKNPFFINLSSQNEKILKKSVEFCKNSIEVCRKLNSDIYTTHPGFNKEVTYNHNKAGGVEIISKEHDKELVINTSKRTITEICDYAQNYDIKIAIETMYNGESATLMHNPKTFIEFFKGNIKNLGILFDTGHMKANSVNLNFDLKESIEKLKRYIIALHLQENTNKGIDEHLPIKNTELLDLFGKDFLKNKYLTLEGQNNWTEQDILDSKILVEKYLK